VRAARDTWVNPVLALSLCTAGGALFAWLRTPLPWMIGPLLTIACCNFAGARLRAPAVARPLGQLVIGVALGLYFTPKVAGQVLAHWPILIAAALFAMLLAWGCAWFLSRSSGTDPATAYFASVPGGAAEMAILGERYGARVERIALAQSLRILVVVIVVPFGLTYSGVQGVDLYSPTVVPFDGGWLLVLLALAAALGGLLAWLGSPNAFMFGPLFVAIAFTASDVQLSSVPAWLSNSAQLLLGATLGSRFEKQHLFALGRYTLAVLASIALALLFAALFGAGLAWLSGLPLATLLLAAAPGGIAEMCITAKVLQLGVPLVTAAHVTRVVVLLTSTAPVFRLAQRLARRPDQ
jgi:membrane AbrB-like protein